MKPVSELLKKRDGTLWHVRPDDTVYAALELLAGYEAGALMVMEGGRLVGVFSERDYTRKIALAGRNSRETHVAEIMTRNVITCTERDTLHDLMERMTAGKFRLMPVVEQGRALGIVTSRDAMDPEMEEFTCETQRREGFR